LINGSLQSERTIVSQVKTPALIYNECEITRILGLVISALKPSGCKLLFPLKACSLVDVLKLIEPNVHGFSVSSINEARLARSVLGPDKVVHFTSPFLTDDTIDELKQYCTSIACNSLEHHEKYGQSHSNVRMGIRINPELSFIKDDRYDPCRKMSKLGVPLKDCSAYVDSGHDNGIIVTGLHFHNNCESYDMAELSKTISVVEKNMGHILRNIDWLNLGGGYFINVDNAKELEEILCDIASRHDIELFFEPGKGIVGSACWMISTVVDIITRDEMKLAVLDTAVCHMPEVFEYQYKPEVLEAQKDGDYEYILCGATCLAGDMFGKYRFQNPLQVGSILTFCNTGAYSLVKASMFNGLNLPSIYFENGNGELVQKHSFDYSDFLKICGVSDYASI